MNIFEQASREAIRFESSRGQLSTEQLWDIPLQSKSGFDLDSIARTVNTSLKSVTEESFVTPKSSPEKAKFELMLEIVKHIIAAKIELNELARARAANAAEKNKLVSILAEKQDVQLKSLSVEEIQARIASL